MSAKFPTDDQARHRRSGWVRLSTAGRYLDADEAALAMLGMTLAELRHALPGSFSAEPPDPAATEALRGEWERTGRGALAGSTTVKRPDGSELALRFLIEPQPNGTMLAVIEAMPEAGKSAHPTVIYTVAGVLSAWRAAERQLEALTPGSPEEVQLRAQIDNLRSEYRRLVDARRGH